MGVGVQGYCDRRVPQHLGDNLGVDVLGQQQRCAGMPEVVKPDGRQPCLLEEWCEGSLPEVAEVTLEV